MAVSPGAEGDGDHPQGGDLVNRRVFTEPLRIFFDRLDVILVVRVGSDVYGGSLGLEFGFGLIVGRFENF